MHDVTVLLCNVIKIRVLMCGIWLFHYICLYQTFMCHGTKSLQKLPKLWHALKEIP